MPKTVNGCYLTDHGPGKRYKRPVPQDLVDVFGKFFKHPGGAYFGAEISLAEAERQARLLMAQDDQRISAARALPEGEREGLARLPRMLQFVRFADALSADWAAYDESVPRFGLSKEMTMRRKIDILMPDPEEEETRQQVARLQVVALKVQRSGEFGWDGLLNLLKRKKPPKDIPSYERSLNLLRECLGEMDYRETTPDHIERWLNWMVETNVTVPMQHHHRSNVSGMLSRAVPVIMKRNPCKGVTCDTAYVQENRVAYTGSEIRKILQTAKAKRIGKSYQGGNAERESLWILRIEAFHGCRVQEPSQLQRGDIELMDVSDLTEADLEGTGVKLSDVVTLNGKVPTIRFRKECAATGKPHHEKSIKNGEDRHIALHPALWCPSHRDYVGESLVEYAKHDGSKAMRGEFLFKVFEWTGPSRGRADYLIQKMCGKAGFVRKVCGIDRPLLSPNHSFRHRMNDALKNAGWDDEDKRLAFLGQGGDVNRRYGNGKAKLLESYSLWRVHPLANI
jgi:integrase